MLGASRTTSRGGQALSQAYREGVREGRRGVV